MTRLMASNPQWAAVAALADISEFGLPELEITTVVDVRAAMVAKRSEIAAHESQVGDFGPFLAMPAEQVEVALRPGVLPPSRGKTPRKAWRPKRPRSRSRPAPNSEGEQIMGPKQHTGRDPAPRRWPSVDRSVSGA